MKQREMTTYLKGDNCPTGKIVFHHINSFRNKEVEPLTTFKIIFEFKRDLNSFNITVTHDTTSKSPLFKLHGSRGDRRHHFYLYNQQLHNHFPRPHPLLFYAYNVIESYYYYNHLIKEE